MAADMLFHVSLWRCQVQLRLAATSKHTHLLEKKSHRTHILPKRISMRGLPKWGGARGTCNV